MPSSAAASRRSSGADPAPAPSSPSPGGTRTIPRGAIAAPLLFVLVVSLCLGGAVLSVSSPRAMRGVGAAIDRLLAETIEEWLDIDTFDPPGLRATDHPVTRWMIEAMRPEHPVLIWPEAGERGPSSVEADVESGDAAADAAGESRATRGPGHVTAAGLRDVPVW